MCDGMDGWTDGWSDSPLAKVLHILVLLLN